MDTGWTILSLGLVLDDMRISTPDSRVMTIVLAGCEKSPSPVLRLFFRVPTQASILIWYLSTYGPFISAFPHFQSEAFLLVESISETLLSRIPDTDIKHCSGNVLEGSWNAPTSTLSGVP